jgi:UMF1 family MFS transporter
MSFSDDGGDDDAVWVEPSRYEGEDTSPTTARELKGWYAYPIAAEVNRFTPSLSVK